MSRETTLQIRVGLEEKATLREKSEGWAEPLSAWARARLLEAPAFPPEDVSGTIDEAMAAEAQEEWIRKRENELKPRMSSRAARRQAEIEWEEKPS